MAPGTKLPSVVEAWAALNALDAQEAGQPDVQGPNYVGPVPTATLVAVLRHLHQRIKALEDAV